MQRFSSRGDIQKWAAIGTVLLSSAAADAKIIYVNGANATPGNGSTWATSYKYLRDGLDASVAGDQIYLAKGIYYPDDGVSGEFGNRLLSFELDGVTIYGGFVGGETSLNQRNPLANVTSLSGEIWEKTNENVYWSIHVAVVSANSTLDGVTVEKGNAQGSSTWKTPIVAEYDEGGGCYVNAGRTLTLANCIFSKNSALSFGGAIRVADNTGGVVATNCVFDQNTIPVNDGSTNSPEGGAIKGRVNATNCRFTANTVAVVPLVNTTNSTARGGAISGDVTATGCVFTGNKVTATGDTSIARGGAIFGNVVGSNCQFSGNIATAAINATGIATGGAISAGSLQAVNCVFTTNQSTTGNFNPDGTVVGGGGAVYISSGISTVVNSVFVKNTSGLSGGAIQSATASNAESLTVLNSTFLDNGVTTGLKGSAIGCGGIVRIMNNIFWNTVATSGTFDQSNMAHAYNKGVLRNTDVDYPTPSTVAQNVVKGGNASITFGAGGNVVVGNAAVTLLTGDPKFVSTANQVGADLKWGTADDGLRLQAGSSAIGVAGDPRITSFRNFLPADTLDIDSDGNIAELLPADIASFVRVQSTYLDLGAYEFGALLHASDISVQYPLSTELTDGAAAAVDFSALSGQPQSFTIKNLGTLPLTGLAVIADGVDVDSFKITQPAATVLNANGSTTFTVTFKPTATGLRNAAVHILSNDPDESPFDINVKGSAQLAEIAVEAPGGMDLISGTSVVDYGSVGLTSTVTKTLTIRNNGLGPLGILGITSTGTGKADFSFTVPGSTLLAPGATTTFDVTFSPSGTGVRTATIIIDNSDADSESTFYVNLSGSGIGYPEIGFSEPYGPELVTGSQSKFGYVEVSLTHAKTFVIKNSGTSKLTNIVVSLAGSKNFSLSKFSVTSLKPGAQAQFKVTFKPTSVGKKTATLTVKSNDANEGKIILNLIGNGKSSSNARQSSGLLALSQSSGPAGNGGVVTATRGADGLKYLVLTVDKSVTPDLSGRTVEVSSNLTKWYSGSKHTTILLDNDSFLRVRDNTPVEQGGKRYIRLR